jgi:hypothetical protein
MDTALAVLRYLFVATIMVGGAYVGYLLVCLAREKAISADSKDEA